MTIPWKKRRENRSNMRFSEWLLIAQHSVMVDALDVKKFTRPKYVGGKRTPDTLSSITLGQLEALSKAKTIADSFYMPCRIILGLTDKETEKALAVDVVRFAGWCSAQLDRITAAFKTIRRPYTSEERQAGAEGLNFGVFGLLDWYARRMGMTEHEQARDTPWIIVYKCMEIDMKQEEYQRRLNEAYLNKIKAKRHK